MCNCKIHSTGRGVQEAFRWRSSKIAMQCYGSPTHNHILYRVCVKYTANGENAIFEIVVHACIYNPQSFSGKTIALSKD